MKLAIYFLEKSGVLNAEETDGHLVIEWCKYQLRRCPD